MPDESQTGGAGLAFRSPPAVTRRGGSGGTTAARYYLVEQRHEVTA